MIAGGLRFNVALLQHHSNIETMHALVRDCPNTSSVACGAGEGMVHSHLRLGRKSQTYTVTDIATSAQ